MLLFARPGPLHHSFLKAATLQLVLDMSNAATIADMRGSRAAAMSTVAQRFIRDFFDQNPLSHLSICLMRRGTAERLTELSGSPVSHVCHVDSAQAHILHHIMILAQVCPGEAAGCATLHSSG